jgi:hypothetical protein
MRRMCKVLVVCLALIAVAVVLPAGVLASDVQLSTLRPYPYHDDMESGSGTWSPSGTWALTQEWSDGTHSLTHSWSDSPGDDYTNHASSTLVSPLIDLGGAAADQHAYLVFQYSCDLQAGQDFVYLEFSGDGGSTWSSPHDSLTGVVADGSYSATIPTEVLTNQFQFRFRLVSDGSVTGDGIHIDDVFMSAGSTGLVQDDSPQLAYVGNWSTAAWSAAVGGGTYKYTSTPGDLVQLSFTGTGVGWMAKMGTQYGKAQVSLDGGAPVLVDLYWDPSWNPGWTDDLYPEGVYDPGNLTDGPHTLTISCSGTKNPASSGYNIGVDRFVVWGTPATATGPTRYQQNDTSFYYAGPWATSATNWSLSGGTFASVDAPGSALNVTFDGTYCAYIAKKGAGYGKAQVVLDGGAPVTVDLYSSYDRYKQRVYNTGLLPPGHHTLCLYWTGQKNAAAWGTKINADAFDVLGALASAHEPDPMLWRYQQNDARVTYLGAWTSTSTWSASGGSLASTGVTGAAALVNFTGTEVKLYAKTAPWYGQAQVSLDGNPPENAEFYSATTLYKQSVYEKTGLSPGPHTLTIKCAGSHHPSSSGYSISLDALDITGYLTQAPAITRYQQDNAAFGRMGTWTTSPLNWMASGGTYASANASGVAVKVVFDGTYLAWVAKTAPWYGIASVTLDGGTAFDVDLYSSSQAYKKQVYNTGLLAYGHHTVVIEWKGTKRAVASGTTIDVDAFDIVGTLAAP